MRNSVAPHTAAAYGQILSSSLSVVRLLLRKDWVDQRDWVWKAYRSALVGHGDIYSSLVDH